MFSLGIRICVNRVGSFNEVLLIKYELLLWSLFSVALG